MIRFISILVTLFSTSIVNVFAAQTDYDENVGWYAYRDLTSDDYADKFQDLADRDFRMTDVEAYVTSSGMRYAMLWERNDGRGWAARRNMSSDRYHTRWTEYRDRGYRPTDVEGYMVGNRLRFAGVWIENTENLNWKSFRNMTHESYSEKFQELSDSGYYMVDMEAYNTPSGLRYAAIWYENTANIQWVQLRNLSRNRYQEEVDSRAEQGYVMVDYEKYQSSNATRYAAIWHRDGGAARIVRTNRNELQYANYFREYRDDGYRPVDFERDGNDYGGIWAKVNPNIANYEHKTALDNILSDYRANNSVPGMSSAIYHNGRLVWSQGSGITSITQKIAHGKTVYPLASVSKVIGGTLVGRLEDQGQRANGAAVDLAGNDTTRSHVPAMPLRHSHTLRQLMAHTACIPHYDTEPGISNQTSHYTSQMAAAPTVWNSPILNGCSIGSSRSYSTHAYTLLGAAMEAATGRTIPQLVREELSVPFALPSLRVMYTDTNLPANYERSDWFSSGVPVPRANNSWKAFGGGIESNAVDLARFGWLTAASRLTSANFRDNSLLVRQPNSRNGYSWIIGTQDGRRRMSHGGSWTGARSQIAIWPDDSLSVVILSNQRGHDGLADLADDMGDLILE